MEMVYQNDTLFVDLSGEIDITRVRNRLFSVVGLYNINKVTIDTTDVFNYKRSVFNELKNDYSRVYGGNITIKR